MTQSIWTRIFDLLAPRTCACCGRRLAISERCVCVDCMLHLPRTAFHTDDRKNAMARLFWGKLPLERATAYFFYQPGSNVSLMLQRLKYDDRPDIGEELGRRAAQEAGTAFFDGIDVIVPMPITGKRRRQRGYNQSQEIARGISSVTGIPICTTAVRRTLFRQSQTRLHFAERQLNVENCFRLADAEAIRGRHVLLVDDIVTTGATLTACGRVLTEAGNVRISILTLGFTKS